MTIEPASTTIAGIWPCFLRPLNRLMDNLKIWSKVNPNSKNWLAANKSTTSGSFSMDKCVGIQPHGVPKILFTSIAKAILSTTKVQTIVLDFDGKVFNVIPLGSDILSAK